MGFLTDYVAITSVLLLVASISFYAGRETMPDVYYNEHNITYFENVSKVHNSTNYVTNEYKNYYERFLMFPDREQSICSKKAKLEQIQEGMSMMPFLYGGDYVYYDPISFKDVKMGDVIIYEQEGERIIHTVVAVYETYLMTAGYNNLGMDYRVMPDEVKARWCFKK